MVREVIRPQYTNLTINIPTSYIDRDIEFIMFPLDEQVQVEKDELKASKTLRGVFNQYANSSKVLQEENAWKEHILDKYKND
jgi:hypothetical protein